MSEGSKTAGPKKIRTIGVASFAYRANRISACPKPAVDPVFASAKTSGEFCC